jgi:lipoyl(octanoyl) transferase
MAIASIQDDCSVTAVAEHTPQTRDCEVYRLGRIGYAEAAALQAERVARRKLNEVPDALLLLEHAPVITWGRNSRAANLLSSPEMLAREGIELQQTNRGGDITFHGPGQLVGYPIICLEGIRKDVVWYVRTLEEALIRTLGDFAIAAFRKPGMTGVWVDREGGPAKVAAIGVHISRWVTSHGFALNVDTNLAYYRHIVPCGIAEHPVTSMRELVAEAPERRAVEDRLIGHFGELFGLSMVEKTL